jgi:hypothetical protein
MPPCEAIKGMGDMGGMGEFMLAVPLRQIVPGDTLRALCHDHPSFSFGSARNRRLGFRRAWLGSQRLSGGYI